MPLSDHEQRLLDEIEQALYAEDPKFANSVRSARTRSRTRRSVAICVIGVLAGLGLVLVGLIATSVEVSIALSVIGFVLVVAACGYAVQTLRGREASRQPGTVPDERRSARQTGLRSRMEERLRRRFDEN